MPEAISTPTPTSNAAPPPVADGSKVVPSAQANGTLAAESSAGLVKDAAKEAMRKFKVKIDGKEHEVDEAELVRGYSHQSAASKKLQEAMSLRKQNEQIAKLLKDPEQFWEVAQKLHQDPKVLRMLAEKHLSKAIEEDLMDPRDRELRDVKTQLQSIKDMELKGKQAVEAKRIAEMRDSYAKDYEKQFVEALQTSDLPPTKQMVGEMARYISLGAKSGVKMTAAEAAKLVREDVLMAQQRLIGDADGEVLLKMLGEQVANKIRKYDTSKIKNPEQALRTPPTEARQSRGVKKERMTAAQWRMHKRGF